MKNLVEELKWRGMIQDIMPGTEEQLNKEVTAAYVGFDPTAESLHIGHLVSIMLLKHLQIAGHKPFALVGGATGMIGDPSGKSEERNFLTEETLRHNQECLKKQLSKYLEFSNEKNSAEIVNNYDWFKEIGFLTFLRDAGKHLTVNYMMAKDSVKKRLETGISFTEFSYQLLQGYDFYWLYKNKGVKLQMGGSDQWGNITSGTELIRRKDGGEAFAFTCPLITKADGTKFGKSEGGNVWLDPKLTSPYQFYQFWLNCKDEDSYNYVKIFTLLPKEEIENLIARHKEAPHLRVLQKAMAEEITSRVHSKEETEKVIKASEILFGKSGADDLSSLDSSILQGVAESVPHIKLTETEYREAKTALDFLSTITKNQIFPSKGEARKMIQNGGVSINKIKVQTPDDEVNFELLKEKYIFVQKGKTNYFIVSIKKA